MKYTQNNLLRISESNKRAQLMTSFGQLIESTTKVADHANNRYLLCKAMQMFANSCESRTKYLVPMFFRFIE
jgi:hypothetical protein